MDSFSSLAPAAQEIVSESLAVVIADMRNEARWRGGHEQHEAYRLTQFANRLSSLSPALAPLKELERAQDIGFLDRMRRLIAQFRALGGIPDLCNMAEKLAFDNEELQAENRRLRVAVSALSPQPPTSERIEQLLRLANACAPSSEGQQSFRLSAALMLGRDITDDEAGSARLALGSPQPPSEWPPSDGNAWVAPPRSPGEK